MNDIKSGETVSQLEDLYSREEENADFRFLDNSTAFSKFQIPFAHQRIVSCVKTCSI